eukprot:EG_transcript_34036
MRHTKTPRHTGGRRCKERPGAGLPTERRNRAGRGRISRGGILGRLQGISQGWTEQAGNVISADCSPAGSCWLEKGAGWLDLSRGQGPPRLKKSPGGPPL